MGNNWKKELYESDKEDLTKKGKAVYKKITIYIFLAFIVMLSAGFMNNDGYLIWITITLSFVIFINGISLSPWFLLEEIKKRNYKPYLYLLIVYIFIDLLFIILFL